MKNAAYTPTVSRRKLKNMTLITAKNLGKVKGDLNRFFKKPAYRLIGFAPKKIGEEIISLHGDTFSQNIFTKEEYPNYRPFLSPSIKVHHCWKEYLEGSYYGSSKDVDDIPRLAITTNMDTNCVPISIGDRYKILGNRLIIMEKYNKYIHRNPYCHSHWLRFKEFIHIPEGEVSADAIFQQKRTAFIHAIAEDTFYMDEEIEYRLGRDTYLGDHLYNVIRDAVDKIEADVREIFPSDEDVPENFHREYLIDEYEDVNENGETIIIPKTLVVDIKPRLWLSAGHDVDGDKVISFCEGEDKTSSIVSAVFSLYKNEIVKNNENETPQEYDDDWDWDW